MRVAYFSPVFRENLDGVSNFMFKLTDFMEAQENVEQMVFTALPPKKSVKTKVVKIKSVTVPFYKDYKISLPTLRSVNKNLRVFKPDIIHVMSPCPLGFYAIKYAKRKNIPVVATYHTHFASYAKYYKVDFLRIVSWKYLRQIYNDCSAVFVPSKYILTELRKNKIKNLVCLPHGVDTAEFNPKYRSKSMRKKLGGDKKTILLYVGRLVWEKDLLVLARAYNMLRRKRQDFVMVLVGDGPIKNDLKKIMPGAKFIGAKYGKELIKIYASSDIFVFPSTTETFGMVTTEAMASGLVPVVADKAGSKSLIQHEQNGLLTQPGNHVDFARKTYYMIDNVDKRKQMADNALDYAKQMDWNVIFSKLIKNYERIIKASQ